MRPVIFCDIDGIFYHHGHPTQGARNCAGWMDPACPFRPAARVETPTWDSATYGDDRNTLEQVHVVGGVETGTWKIIVNTRGVASLTGTQPFALMVTMN